MTNLNDLEDRETDVEELLYRKKLLKKRNSHAHNRIVRAATAKLEHEFEKEKSAGNARAAGTFADWLASLPWTEILKLIAELLKLFS